MSVWDLSTIGPDAQERTGLQPRQSVSTLVLLLGNILNTFEPLDPESSQLQSGCSQLTVTPDLIVESRTKFLTALSKVSRVTESDVTGLPGNLLFSSIMVTACFHTQLVCL